MTTAHEPGSPVLVVAETGVETFDHPDALARRVHELRGAAGLDVTVGHATTGGPTFPGVLIWKSAPRLYLAFAAGPDVDTPSRLLTALSRTRASVAA